MLAMVVLALANNFALADLPTGQPVTLNEVNGLVEQIADFLMSVGLLGGVIYIIWSGITYMMAGAEPTKVTEAKERLKTAIIGTAVVLGVGVIIQTIAGIVTRDFFCRVRIPIVGSCLFN